MSFGDYTKQFHIAEMEDYNKGDVIFKEGASGDWIYVIMRGEIEIYKMVKGKKIVVDVLKEGDLFGEVSFIDKQPRSAGARALSEVTLGVFDKNYINEQYNKLPNNFRVIFDAMARRLRKMTAVATNLASRGK
jgi:CRP-like cAMP-binding protein